MKLKSLELDIMLFLNFTKLLIYQISKVVNFNFILHISKVNYKIKYIKKNTIN
jgi:hypothetical protein